MCLLMDGERFARHVVPGQFIRRCGCGSRRCRHANWYLVVAREAVGTVDAPRVVFDLEDRNGGRLSESFGFSEVLRVAVEVLD